MIEVEVNERGDIMPTITNIIIILVALLLWVLLIVGLTLKMLRRRNAPVVSVKAVVVDCRREEVFSKYAGSGKTYKYLVVFSAEGKKLSFYVSEFSFRQYQTKRSGILKYKGDRLLDFS